MQNVTIQDILVATGGQLLCGDANTVVTDLCINSNEIKEGDLFVPIIGEKVNAHKFIEQALTIGAATLTSEHYAVNSEKPYIRVEDTVKALQQIGTYIRNKIHLPIVAVTGSVGKTTTRQMIREALATSKRVFQTSGNYNSQIGVPIMLSRLTYEDEMAVLELGMSEKGQITRLSQIVRPNIAVVTTIGVAHIEYLKTRENIRTEKLHIIDGMEENGVLFLNGDDPMLAEMRGKMPCTTYYYGTKEWCDYRAENIRFKDGNSYFDCVHGRDRVEVVLNVLGNHNVSNSLAAIGVADVCHIPMTVSSKGFKEFEGLRQKIVNVENKYTIIDDTYNASPDSMKASLNVLMNVETNGRRVAVLGDMFELGEDAELYHYEVGKYVATVGVDELVVVGQLAKHIKQAVVDSERSIPVYEFEDNEEVAIYLMATLLPEDLVLVKGSNGMHMNEIVNILCS